MCHERHSSLVRGVKEFQAKKSTESNSRSYEAKAVSAEYFILG